MSFIDPCGSCNKIGIVGVCLGCPRDRKPRQVFDYEKWYRELKEAEKGFKDIHFVCG